MTLKTHLRIQAFATLVLLVLLLMANSARACAQGDELSRWLHSKGFRKRVNPGTFSLLGYVFDSPELRSLQASAKECFSDGTDATKSILGPHQEHETSVYDAVYRKTSIAGFLELTRPSSLTDAQLYDLTFALHKEGVRITGISLQSVTSKMLSSISIETGLKSKCMPLMSQDRDWIIGESLGVRKMSYVFYSRSGKSLTLSGKTLDMLV
jgi:hypothetical protein